MWPESIDQFAATRDSSGEDFANLERSWYM